MAKMFSVLQSHHFDDFWEQFPLFTNRPLSHGGCYLEGDINLNLQCPDGREFRVKQFCQIEVFPDFPRTMPIARVRQGQLSSKWDHFLNTKRTRLCLGSPLRIRQLLAEDPSLLGFVKKAVLPYFANYEARIRGESLPYGELDHSLDAVKGDYMGILFLHEIESVIPMLKILSMKRRVGNKRECPCGSGRTLGRCHAPRLGELRKSLMRRDFLLAAYNLLKN